jgi:hypothetical protein
MLSDGLKAKAGEGARQTDIRDVAEIIAQQIKR